ncbi:MAG: hypothetical protein JJT94_05915 [Bernardetiaceae bacterium]|nr:hypothetical protein [Bernardetiaceae bacterium]
MAFSSFFKLPKHRRFSYEPRVYNSQKESLEKRKRTIEARVAYEKKRLADTEEDFELRLKLNREASPIKNALRKKVVEKESPLSHLMPLLFIGLIGTSVWIFFEQGGESFMPLYAAGASFVTFVWIRVRQARR